MASKISSTNIAAKKVKHLSFTNILIHVEHELLSTTFPNAFMFCLFHTDFADDWEWDMRRNGETLKI